MLCKTCFRMLRGGLGTENLGISSQGVTFERQTFQHHGTMRSLEESEAIVGCSICKALANELRKRAKLHVAKDEHMGVEAQIHRLEDRDSLAIRRVSGSLAESSRMYQLDFVHQKTNTILRTFALTPTSHTSTHQLRTPKSNSTSSDEVLELSKRWIENCSCYSPSDQWYPTRLLDLDELRNAKGMRESKGLKILSENKDLDRAKIKLVEGKCIPALESRTHTRYVTLSHCWGAPKQDVLKLTIHNERSLKDDGVELSEFPRTFQDAMLFACRLDKVRYIWIDSLCIKQKSSSPEADAQASEKDWFEQSRTMDKIYKESYLNISATASSNSDQGLFRSRSPEFLWEDEVNLYCNWGSNVGNVLDPLTRCTIIDVSFWEDLVEQAPVNQRGWVLQERMLCPRVLHFCRDQIAWECREFQYAEGYPEQLPTWRKRSSHIVDEGLLKGLEKRDGDRLREIRLKGFLDPDRGLEDLHIFELWKRVVEVYSKTKLSFSSDKLIALSGIARRFSEMFPRSSRCDYVAGMWSKPKHLESQLLWQVEPVYKDGVPESHSERHSMRAPSFSWASLDTPQGIIYGETTDYGSDRANQLFFEIRDYHVTLADKENRFGMLQEGQGRIWLEARYLKRIKITKDTFSKNSISYSWYLYESKERSLKHRKPLDYPIVYLDTPELHVNGESDAELYCMPAAFGQRTAPPSERTLICLLLKLQKEKDGGHKSFTRFGLTKLFSFSNQGSLAALQREEENEIICLC